MKRHLAKAGIIMIVGVLSAISGLVSYELFKDKVTEKNEQN